MTRNLDIETLLYLNQAIDYLQQARENLESDATIANYITSAIEQTARAHILALKLDDGIDTTDKRLPVAESDVKLNVGDCWVVRYNGCVSSEYSRKITSITPWKITFKNSFDNFFVESYEDFALWIKKNHAVILKMSDH